MYEVYLVHREDIERTTPMIRVLVFWFLLFVSLSWENFRRCTNRLFVTTCLDIKSSFVNKLAGLASANLRYYCVSVSFEIFFLAIF